MNWIEVIKTTFGPLIGAAIALAAIWVKEFYERKRAIQDWYENSYIEQGVDRLISYALQMEFTLNDMLGFGSAKSPLAHDEIQTIPTESIIKLQTILQNDVFTNLFPALYASVRSLAKEDGDPEEINGIMRVAHVLHEGLFDLRQELLNIKIKRKAGVYRIAGKPEILSALTRIEAEVEEARTKVFEIEEELRQAQPSRPKKHRALRRGSRKPTKAV